MRAWHIPRGIKPDHPLLLILLLYLAITALTFNQIEEDAFIYFRLAKNIAAGHGYVFNPGGEAIEAGSSLIWQLMLVPLCWLPIDMIIGAKLLGIGFGCLALWLTSRLSRLLISDAALRYFPSLLLAVSVPFFCWSQRGLEISFYLCTLLTLCYVCCHERYRAYWYLPAVALFCSRPEGFLISLALIPFLIIEHSKIPHFARGLAIFVLACCGVTLARLWYFHDPVPFPFYLKGSSLSLGSTASSVHAYFKGNYLVFLAVPLVAGFARRRFWSAPAVYVLSFFLITGIWAVTTGDNKPYQRHLLPTLTFLYLLSVASLDMWMTHRAARIGTRFAGAIFIVVLLFGAKTIEKEELEPNLSTAAVRFALRDPAWYFVSLSRLIRDPSRPDVALADSPLHGPIDTNYQATTGKFLRDNYPKNITIVYDQMGQTPWYAGSDKSMIDSFGLLTRTTGYHSFHRQSANNSLLRLYEVSMWRISNRLWPDERRLVSDRLALDYVFDRNPELIMFNRVLLDRGGHSLTVQIARDRRLRERYTLAYVVNTYARIYERKDIYSPNRDRIPRGANVKNLGSSSRPRNRR